MTLLELAVLSLAVYRLSRLITIEDGPGDVFKKLRTRATAYYNADGEPEGFWGKLLHCPWCVGLWISLIIWPIYALNASACTWIMLSLALNGLAGFLYERENG